MGEAPENNPDDLVAGKYRLVRMIGQGGMGSVWEGEHVTLGTRVAIKFIEHELADSDEARSRFDQEARAAAKLQSRYVVAVHDHGLMPDRRPFIVMEYLQGQTLEDRTVARGRLDLVETSLIIAQVAKGLAKAHELGIVHRDLKPENIFLTDSPDDDEQVAKIVDFGIAKFTEGAPAGMSSSTRTGTILGTPVYMSPEQARGLRDIDFRSDLWALGVVVYRCVVGRLPFQGEAVGDIVVKICTQDPVLPTQVDPMLPRGLDTWFSRCVARERQERFASVKELAATLLVVAGVISHPDQAFPLTNAASAPGPNLMRSPPSVHEASSKVELENAATQIGTTSSVSHGAKPRSVGLLVAVVVGGLMLAGGIGAWRWASAGDGDDVATGPDAVLSHGVVGAPEGTSVGVAVGAPASAGLAGSPSVSGASSVAEVPEVTEPVVGQPRTLPGPRTQPTAKGSRTSFPPKPPPGSTGPVDLGY
jgi:serine/threonine-protein kinase